MSGCVEFESSMTGSTRTGPLGSPLNSALLANDNKSSPTSLSSPSTADSSSSACFSASSSSEDRLEDSFLDIFQSTTESTFERSSQLRQERTPMRQKMTPVRPQSGQPIQLTPLWEHVVRTRRFPSEVNTRETFDEITERLRDPEWEVRQHALRVLVDVLPTLDREIVDDTMTNVLPELVNNLGHVAPAVRKGALDTLRVYLVCSRRKDDIVEGILDDALGHQDTLDNFQTNVTRGVILSIPSLLFPSSSSVHSKEEILRRAIDSLVSRLVQVTYQEASIRSLSKINEHLGDERFNVYLDDLNVNARRDYELLRDVYGVKTCDKNGREKKIDKNKRADKMGTNDAKSVEEFTIVETRENDACKDCDNEKVSMRINEDSGNKEIDISLMSRAPRILLETEIKFNEETAITMTIIERQKDINEESDDDSDFDSGDESTKNHDQQVARLDSRDGRISNDDGIADEWIETRKTPRRVHFGGEIVKLRTPDSDDSELVQRNDVQQTRIPIPVSAGSIGRINSTVRTRRSRSNPCSPNIVRSRNGRKTKSVTNSPKREFYTHDAALSPKKSILAKIGLINSSINPTKTLLVDGKRKMEDRVNELFGKEENDSSWAFEIYDNDNFPDSNHDDNDVTINSRDSTINRETTMKKRHSAKLNNRRNSEIGKVRINDSGEMIGEIVFPDSSLDTIESTTIKSATPTGNREISKKKRDSAKLKKEERRNSEIGKIRINDTEEMTEETVFPDLSLDTIELTMIKSATPTGNREISKKKRDSAKLKNEERRNGEIGKIRIQDTEEMMKENVFPDSSLDMIESTSPSGNREISKKKRDSAKLKNEERGNSEIGKIRINDAEEMIEEIVFPDSSLESMTNSKENSTSAKEKQRKSELGEDPLNDGEKMIDVEKSGSNSCVKTIESGKNRENSTKKRTRMSSKIGTNNEKSGMSLSERVKVESVELVKGSVDSMWESCREDFPDKKKENGGQTIRAVNISRNKRERKGSLPTASRETEVCEKLEDTSSERNVRSLSLDSQSRSPKKLVFETFPRKERNYILMELSSPVKTNNDKKVTNENAKRIDESKKSRIPENNSSLSRGNSPLVSSKEHLFVDRNDSPNNSTVVDSIVVKSNDNTNDNEMPFEDIQDGKRSSDEEANPLPDIILNETTKFRESNWEELGLVDQEVINDLHNKDDWRARVRGLERVASALRTSSALMAIESRLGSLLQAVLGGERSCRVAAAGMAVARVVVAGVSEEALKRRLPQVAWGLARQGGPNAAQLARVAMLRLRPALMLEQLLQPHCIKARNAKTRENALQLLIFSLVTFPSTEFKVENVAYKVASMVGDRRRRVRQAALDTLAVLAQIYEPEEVTRAGKLAAKGQQDGDSMVAAIRARLARKSLPMVSADGLVVYGLQISPTVQIATGPDVDWIVAGSGSVSPGTGRTRGQIIATTTRQGVQEKNAKNETTRSNASAGEPNFVALGVGLDTKNEQEKPLAWQLFQNSTQNESLRTREKWSTTEKRDENFGVRWNEEKSRLTGTLRQYRSASERLDDSFPSSDSNPVFIIDDKDLIMKQRKTEENFHRRMDEIYAERTGVVPVSQDIVGKRLESKIPIPHSRERETSINDARIGISYPRRRIIREEEGNAKNWSASSRVSDISRPRSTLRNDQAQLDEQRTYEKSGRDSSPQRSSQTRETYRSTYRQGRGFADGNVYREVQTAPTTTSYDVTRRRQSIKESTVTRITKNARRIVPSNAKTSTRMILDKETRGHDAEPRGNSTFYNGAENNVEEDEYDEKNKRHFSVQANSYKIQESNDRSSQCSARMNNGTLENWSNASSDVSGDRTDGLEVMEKISDDRASIEESRSIDDDDDIRVSSSKCPNIEKSFDVITRETNPSRRNSIDYGISSGNGNSGGVVYTTENENIEYEETDKDSSNDDNAFLVPRDVERLSSDENFETKNHDYPIDDTRIEKSWNIEDEDCDVGTSKDPVDNNSGDSSDFGVSKVSEDSPISNESSETDVETFDPSICPARVVLSPYAILSIEEGVGSDNAKSSTDESDGPEAAMSYREYERDSPLKNVVRAISPSIEIDTIVRTEVFVQRTPDENTISMVDEPDRSQSRENNRDHGDAVSFRSIDSRKRRDSAVESSIVTRIAEKEQGSLSVMLDESINRLRNFDVQPGSEESATTTTTTTTTTSTSTTITENFSSDSTNRGNINRSSNTGNETAVNVPEINGARASTSEKSEFNRKIGTSKVPRIRQKSRANIARVAPMQPVSQVKDRNSVARSRTSIQQCFAQLESTDWEIAIKGLKELSTIARQEPEQLDSCSPGTIGRLLGRHVRNLRSQVSRAACLAAGDVFSSQARCIDQDLDDIAGPLLHRTADTNKFLRADSNDALDRMVENLPPNKTIGVIVHRGATHQNAIVRATTARLLASIVDRVGTDWIMSLPREGREKLIASSAKLLMDGNLDARNNAKQIFRKLSRCDGFRKLLKDSVPEATLRHIDKTLKSL